MSESFASRFMSPDEKTAMVARDPQSAQALTNAPRTGFAHNCYAGGLGMFFQKTIKNTILEKFLDQAWQGFLKYRCAGSKAAYREAKKNPDAVFQYDDPLLALLPHVAHHRPGLTEDIYYRARCKEHLRDILAAVAEHPEYLDLSLEEEQNIRRWNGCSP